MFFDIPKERSTAELFLGNVLTPALNRPEDKLRRRLLVGSAEECAEKLVAYEAAGGQRVFPVARRLWPTS